MMASVEGCVVETVADSTKQPKVEGDMFVGLSLCYNDGNELKRTSCKLPDAPQDVSPKSLSSFTDTLSMLETIPVVKSHKRQRSDAMVENSPAQDSFLVRQNSSVADSQRVPPQVDSAEDLCKPRAVYPINFKAPKMYNSPQSRRSQDMEIPGGWSQIRRSPSDSFVVPSNFNVGLSNKASTHTNHASENRRLSRHRSRTNSYTNHNGGVYEQVDAFNAPSDDGDHSQISIDLERISLAATSFSPLTLPRPTLRPSLFLPVVFSPIQHVAYKKFDTFVVAGVTEGSIDGVEEDEEEDQELVTSLPTEEVDSSNCGVSYALHSHLHYHQQEHQQNLHKPYFHPSSSIHIVPSTHNPTIPPPTCEAAYMHCIPQIDSVVVEASELLDDDMLIFNMDA